MISLICQQCGQQFSRKPSAVVSGKGRFCSLQCYNAHRITSTSVECAYCGTVFKTSRTRVDASVSGNQFCSSKCAGARRKGWVSPLSLPHEQIVKEYAAGATLRELAAKYDASVTSISGHITRARKEGLELRQTTVTSLVREARSRAALGKPSTNRANLPLAELIAAYQTGKSTYDLASQHSVAAQTIARHLKQSGITLRDDGLHAKVLCSDGHIVASRLEFEVDEWLHSHNLPHTIHPKTPWAAGRKVHRADFLVRDTFIEVWGIEGIAKYDAKRSDKIALYRAHNCRLIELFPHQIHDGDFSPLYELLNPD